MAFGLGLGFRFPSSFRLRFQSSKQFFKKRNQQAKNKRSCGCGQKTTRDSSAGDEQQQQQSPAQLSISYTQQKSLQFIFRFLDRQ